MWMDMLVSNMLVSNIAAKYIMQAYSELCVHMYTSACWAPYSSSAAVYTPCVYRTLPTGTLLILMAATCLPWPQHEEQAASEQPAPAVRCCALGGDALGRGFRRQCDSRACKRKQEDQAWMANPAWSGYVEGRQASSRGIAWAGTAESLK